MKELFSNFNGHLIHFSIYDKMKIRSKWRKMNRIHILSRTGRWKKLKTYIFYFSYKKDGWVEFKNRYAQWIISAYLFVFVENNFFTFRAHSWQRVPNPQASSSCISYLPPFFRFFPTPTPFLFFCFVSMTGHVIAPHVFDDFLVVRVFQITLRSGEGEWKILIEGWDFLSGGGNWRRSEFDHSNLFQS